MAEKIVEAETNEASIIESDGRDAVDALLDSTLINANRELDRQECKELLAFIEQLKSLDNVSFENKVDTFLKYNKDNKEDKGQSDYYIFKNSNVEKDYIFKVVIQGMESLKKQNITDPCQSIKFLYSKGLFYSAGSFLNYMWLENAEKKYKGNELLKRKNAIWRIIASIELQIMISELKDDKSFAEIKAAYCHVLTAMYEIGRAQGCLSSIEDMPPKEIADIIRSQVSRIDINNARYATLHKFNNIMRQIAKEKYDNGDTDWHNDMANKMAGDLIALQKDNAIQDAVILQYKDELEQLGYKPDIKKYKDIKDAIKDTIMEAIREVAYRYKRVNGVHNNTKII